MASAKLTNIRLCTGVPLDVQHNHTIMFGDKIAQYTYFNSKTFSVQDECSYQRELMRVAYPAEKDTINQAGYMMYQNSSFSDKWFYAFIQRIEYVNDSMSYIYFIIDYYQTYQFDIKIGQAFIEREHTVDDTFGKYTLDEPVAIGDYRTRNGKQNYFDKWWLVVGSTIDLEDYSETAGATLYDGIYSGMKLYTYQADNLGAIPLNTALFWLAQNGQSDAIVTMYMIPDVNGLGFSNGKEMPHSHEYSEIVTYNIKGTLDGYTPRNNKLLTYPYFAIMLSNKSGNTVQLRPEYFGNYPNIQLNIVIGVHPGSRAILVPHDYDGATNYDNALPLVNFPQVCWQTDVYANWLAGATVKFGYAEDKLKRGRQNTVNLMSEQGGMAGQIAGSLLGPQFQGIGRQAGLELGATFGEMVNSLPSQRNQYGMDYYNISSQMEMEKEIHSIEPNSVRGTIGNDFTLLSNNLAGYTIQERTINAEHARAIDDFFDAYGYRVNRIGTPNLTSRPNWNFIKCSSITLSGALPMDALEAIRNMFLSGVTFWHTTDVGNYSLNNRP